MSSIEQVLLRSGNARLTINQVSEALHLSVRTLRRRLREDGTSFRELCERIRVDCAQRLAVLHGDFAPGRCRSSTSLSVGGEGG